MVGDALIAHWLCIQAALLCGIKLQGSCWSDAGTAHKLTACTKLSHYHEVHPVPRHHRTPISPLYKWVVLSLTLL